MRNHAIKKHSTRRCTGYEQSKNFDPTVFKDHRISTRVTISSVYVLSTAAWFLLVASDGLVMTSPVLGTSFLFGFENGHLMIETLHKKWSFPLRISSVNVTKSKKT